MIFAPRPIVAPNAGDRFKKVELAHSLIMHVDIDKHGVAVIRGTRIKVKQLVSLRRAWGWTAEQIRENLPQLAFDQIYAAFAYYDEHQAALEAEMDADDREAERLATRQAPDPALIKRLREASKRT